MLCYIGDGLDGLFGYTHVLKNKDDRGLRCIQLVEKLEEVENSRQVLQLEFDQERNATIVSGHEDWRQYAMHMSQIQARSHEAKLLYQAQLQRLQEDVAGHIEDKQRQIQEATTEEENLLAQGAEAVNELHNTYQSQIADLDLKLLKTKNNLVMTKLKIDRLSKSPFCRPSLQASQKGSL